MLGRICQGLSGAFIMPASLALIKTYWDGRRPSTCGQPLVHGILGWFRVRRAVRRPHGRERRLALDLLRVGGGVSPRDADGPRHPGEQGSRSRELYVRHEGCADVHGHDGRAAGAHDPGQSDRLDEPDHPWAGRGRCRRWCLVLQGRVCSAISVRELRALSQRDVHGSDGLELPVERRCRDAAGVDDAGAGRWWPVGTGGRDADARLRDCHRCLHPRGREAACKSSARAGR